MVKLITLKEYFLGDNLSPPFLALIFIGSYSFSLHKKVLKKGTKEREREEETIKKEKKKRHVWYHGQAAKQHDLGVPNWENKKFGVQQTPQSARGDPHEPW